MRHAGFAAALAGRPGGCPGSGAGVAEMPPEGHANDFVRSGSLSFSDLLAAAGQQYLPAIPPPGPADPRASGPASELPPHGTTIVTLEFPGGVVMAGDRRATMGSLIAARDIEKVFPADQHCCVGIAGSAGIALELVRLFQVELEHYEKIEGTPLSLSGKANRLGALLRANLGLAMQGLGVLPVLAGYDLDAERGRIFSYDITGGHYDERGYHSVGSGSLFARGSLKKLYQPGLPEAQVVAIAVEALYDAADDDSATGGPDLARRIYPVVAVVDASGYRRLGEAEVAAVAQSVVNGRMQRPDGPLASVEGVQDE